MFPAVAYDGEIGTLVASAGITRIYVWSHISTLIARVLGTIYYSIESTKREHYYDDDILLVVGLKFEIIIHII